MEFREKEKHIQEKTTEGNSSVHLSAGAEVEYMCWKGGVPRQEFRDRRSLCHDYLCVGC